MQQLSLLWIHRVSRWSQTHLSQTWSDVKLKQRTYSFRRKCLIQFDEKEKKNEKDFALWKKSEVGDKVGLTLGRWSFRNVHWVFSAQFRSWGLSNWYPLRRNWLAFPRPQQWNCLKWSLLQLWKLCKQPLAPSSLIHQREKDVKINQELQLNQRYPASIYSVMSGYADKTFPEAIGKRRQ